MAADLFVAQLNVKISHASVQAEAMITAITIRSTALSMACSFLNQMTDRIAPEKEILWWMITVRFPLTISRNS